MFVWLMLIFSTMLHAEIIADPSVPGNQQPMILLAPNDIPLVNIQTPSEAGVSRNVYSQFDVESSGAILNNSKEEVQTQLGGWIQANPWLGNESARVILNEVNSLDQSLLKGYLEVAGDQADVVVANPLGITCEGCGFINAHRATLSAGIPILNRGDLEGYTVQRGVVQIKGAGMDTKNTSYTDILARAASINASIWANELTVTTMEGVGAKPVFAIDMAELGGMYAGQIFLICTESGVGVTNAGKMYASLGNVFITADGSLENRSQGRVYGDQVSIEATDIKNESVIAAREQLDIKAAGTIDNTEKALLFSGGDLNLESNNLNNDSGTIEALHNINIITQTLNNTNPHFSTKTETVETQDRREYQGDGYSKRYLEWTPGVRRGYNDNGSYLLVPEEGTIHNFLEYDYVRKMTETQIDHSVPGQILSGSDMNIIVETLNNDKSRIVSGGNFAGTIGQLNNGEVKGERLTMDIGVVTYYWRTYNFGHHAHTQTLLYEPFPEIEPIVLLSGEVGQGAVNLTVPDNGLFGFAPDQTVHYVIETDPLFTNHRQWLGSDYLLRGLLLDPSLALKRLGDGYYEQQLIKEQALRLTGRRFLGDDEDDETQYQALMDNGIAYAQKVHWSPGISLSAAQVAVLTSDMVLLVEKEVRLSNGSLAKVLVPQLYIAAQEPGVADGLINGKMLNLQLSGNLNNSGTIIGHQGLTVRAENLNNVSGRLGGEDVHLETRGDINNLGAVMAASKTLFVRAGNDINLTASTVTNSGEGNTTLAAGNDLNLKVMTTSGSEQLVWGDQNYQKSTKMSDTGSTIQTQGDLNLEAGHDLTIKAGTVQTKQGNLTAQAGNHIQVSSGQNKTVTEQRSQKESGTLFSKTVTRIHEIFEKNTPLASTLESLQGDVKMVAGGGYHQTGGNIMASGEVSIQGQQVDIKEDRENSRHEIKTTVKQSGFSGGVSNPVVTAVQTANDMRQAAKNTDDGRLKTLAVVNTVLVVPNKVGGLGAHMRFKKSKTQLESEVLEDSAKGAVLRAGKKVHLAAQEVIVQGASVEGVQGVHITSEKDVQLLAAKNIRQQKNKNKGHSQRVGFGREVTGGLSATGSKSQSEGQSTGRDINWTNTHVTSDALVMLNSGNDTTLKGAVVKGQQVVAEVGGDLRIESLQDTSDYHGRQKSVSVSASVPIGAGGASGSVNIQNDSVNSRYASVTEQSGIKAGDGGFQVQVKGNTALTGGMIASNDANFKDNQLTTDTLTHKDVHNIAEVKVDSRGIQLSDALVMQGKYGATKSIATNVLAHSNKKDNRNSLTKSTVSAAEITVKTNPETISTLNKDVETAHQTIEKHDVKLIQKTVQANRAIQDQTLKTATILTDEAYRTRFEKAATLIKGTCPAEVNCVNNPEQLKWVIITKKEIKNAPAGSVLVTNGILNDEKRAVALAYQNMKFDLKVQDKPQEFYLMHIAPANNVISELLGVAYEKITASSDYQLANFLGYTTGQETYAALLKSRKNKDTGSLGHSRGALTQEAAFTILTDRAKDGGNSHVNPFLKIKAVGGASNMKSFTEKAVKAINTPGSKKDISFAYFENDLVSVVIGGNKGVWNLKDLWEVLLADNSMHSCYGAGAAGCKQVENPVPGGPQGSIEGNKKLKEYVGGDVKNEKSELK